MNVKIYQQLVLLYQVHSAMRPLCSGELCSQTNYQFVFIISLSVTSFSDLSCMGSNVI